ncbi:MAG: outer membrane protein assembly factor BamA [Dysgonamonadaceae bacterium]|jgi:outer membrane protein insertion porin family|nr:outer membrane protein assembly factor BamA [Dysgonamonadaceae bacterium]
MLRVFYLASLFIFLSFTAGFGQIVATDTLITNPSGEIDNPPVNYTATPKKGFIADIKVSGLEKTMYQDFVLIGLSGLQKGQEIQIPGEDITNAINRFWKNGLFSDAKIYWTKVVGDSIWLEIKLTDRPRVSDIRYSGMKKSEREDIESKIGMVKGNQITPNQLDRAKIIIKSYFAEKGFNEAEINIMERPDGTQKNHVILDINVDKKEKTGIYEITIEGNEALSDRKLKGAMKKTNEWGRLKNILNLFKTKKFIEANYEEDKKNLITKYNEYGYRDAEILSDTVYRYNDKKVNIGIKVSEGSLYHIRSINWVGNTQYNSYDLGRLLNMKAGDVYNQKKLGERLKDDEDAAMNLYQNNGYLFSGADPVEVNVDRDSVDLEIRVNEGPKATIKKVIIQGNDRLYEDVIRRELRTKPGAVYSKEALIRSFREIAQTGHFDPENMNPDVVPNLDDGTVNIGYPLTSKGNDQVEFSAGWGVTGLVGKLSLKLNNFSLKNLLYPGSYKGIIPQGEGQSLVLSAQTNGQYYQSYQASFSEPWFGGKRPNNFSVSAYYSRYTGMNSNYYSQNNYYNMYSMYGYGGYGGSNYQDYAQYSYDPDKVFEMIGFSLGYGKRLEFPDDYFYMQAELGFQRYNLKNWTYNYFPFRDGASNSVSLNLTIARNSVDNPLYTRSGSQFTLSVAATPPFSAWDGKDYANMPTDEYGYERATKYTWNEYHKWKFKVRTFTPIANVEKTPVLATRAEFGLIGYYNKHKQTPFETFDVGGDGMSGYSSSFATETIALRGYENNSVAQSARAYTRYGLEVRYPFILEPSSTIWAAAFVEAGNAWMETKSFNPFDLKRSAGVGARIFLPMIGLMGIDWAYGFDTVIGTGTRERGGSQFHFIIGQEF